MTVGGTLVQIRARHSIARVPHVTAACEGSHCIGASRGTGAGVATIYALVYIRARARRASVPPIATAGERANGVYTNRIRILKTDIGGR